jgi:hypothetical protein
MKIKLTGGEIDSYASDIYKVLLNVPLFYLTEVLELAAEGRVRDGDDPELDVSSSEDEEAESSDEDNSDESSDLDESAESDTDNSDG